ncbi:MAG: DUF3883 domain-containing protein [bacterium]|nr:DUF3883 domain-containing protein [bacterium]
MKPQNELALVIAYYLSRFDKNGYLTLGYKSFNEAAREVGRILDVKPNTVKNMRDEFDPYHQNSRIGWKRELRGSRLKILKAFQETDDETLLEIVKEILYNIEFKKSEEYGDIRTLFGDKKQGSYLRSPIFILRGPTGKNAESLFMKHFQNTTQPVKGKLIDCRDLGSGYDFEIQNENGSYFIEVKGLSLSTGGILFTNKEWQTALRYGGKYYLVIVKYISVSPEIIMSQNPTLKLKAQKNIYTTLQVNWTISNKILSNLRM